MNKGTRDAGGPELKKEIVSNEAETNQDLGYWFSLFDCFE